MAKTHYLGIIFTKHAINRLYNRGISQEQAWKAINYPDRTTSGKVTGSTKFIKKINQNIIEVVAKKNELKEWVILSCWKKNMYQSSYRKRSWLETLLDLVRQAFS